MTHRAWVLAALVVAAGCGGSHAPPEEPLPPPEPFSAATLVDPPRSLGPWVRWWWPGNDVADEELAREVEALAAAGFGGAEIQAFDAALDPGAPPAELARRQSYGTEQFFSHLRAAGEAARAHGMAIDLTLGSGWPVGGATVAAERSLATMLWREEAVEGPSTVTVDVSSPQKPAFYVIAPILQLFGEPLARWEGALAERIAVLAARVTGGARSGNPLDLRDALELEAASVVDLSRQVNADGTLTWEVPAGRWQVIAFFVAPDGELPILNAEPEPGYVVDHLNRDEVVAYLEEHLGAQTGLPFGTESPFRAVFDDSLELKSERHVTFDFVDEFRRRRGYDPTPWLPAVVVPGADNYVFEAAAFITGAPFVLSDLDERVRYDWSRTVSDLFLERWYGTLREWSGERGLLLRAQPYGAAYDVLRAQGMADIPETEQLYAGGSELALKMASSAAALYGKRIVSAETMPWAGRDHMTTPAKMKLAADKLFAAGVNQVVFHGFPYVKSEGYGESGWNPFSSPWSGLLTFASHVAERDPFWLDQPALNRYLARCQYALRQGEPAIDVLVYYPWLGFPSNFQFIEDHDETLFKGSLPGLEPAAGFDQLYAIGRAIGLSGIDPRAAWLARLWPMLEELSSGGLTWGWVNDERLALARAVGGEIDIAGRRYRALAIADAPTLEPAAAKQIAALAVGDVPVLLAGELPATQPGLDGASRGDAVVRDAISRTMRGARVAQSAIPDGAAALLATGLEPRVRLGSGASPVRHALRRVDEGGQLWFFWNPLRQPVHAQIAVPGCADARWFDAWTGAVRDAGGADALDLELPAWGTAFLTCSLAVPIAVSPDGTEPLGVGGALVERMPLTAWHLAVEGDDVSDGAFAADLDELRDWREIEALRHSSSNGVYQARAVGLELATSERAVLSLGWIAGAADVRVNGEPAGRVLAPPFELDVTDRLVAGENVIEVEVTPLRRNRYIGRGLSGDPAYAQFAGRPDDLVATGLLGPAFLERRRP